MWFKAIFLFLYKLNVRNTDQDSLTHHVDRKQERSTALNRTWAWKRNKETFPAVALLPQESFQRIKPLCSSTTPPPFCRCAPQNHLPLFTKRTPRSWYPLTFRESSLYFVLVQEEHKHHLGGYPESRGFPWRISAKICIANPPWALCCCRTL